ncbi:MAG: hypothetical protein QGG87_00285, partial [Nitrospinota bacterium]|nr:hypothetical protein [Nitrospinota bacterium]
NLKIFIIISKKKQSRFLYNANKVISYITITVESGKIINSFCARVDMTEKIMLFIRDLASL